MNNIYVILISAILFLAPNLLNYIGIDTKLVHALIIGISIPLLVIRRNEVLSNKPLIGILLLVGTFSFHKLTTDTGEGARMAVLQILGAPIIYAAVPKLNYKLNKNNVILWRKLSIAIFIFYTIETGMAILERIIGHNILGWSGGIMDLSSQNIGGFRSTALLGHPLNNALIVSTMMSFILFSQIKLRLKLVLWVLGYLAILCFNTRSSIVGNAMIFATYFLYTLFMDKTIKHRDKKTLIFLSICIFFALMIVITTTQIGGRLFELGLFDEGSAQARIDTWSIFNYFKLEDFLWGIDYNHIQIILYSTGIIATENFWIDFLFSFGFVFLCIYTILYIALFTQLFKHYQIFNKTCIISTFILIASTNNSLSSSFLPLFIFMLLSHIFDSKYTKLLIPAKYLNHRICKSYSNKKNNYRTSKIH